MKSRALGLVMVAAVAHAAVAAECAGGALTSNANNLLPAGYLSTIGSQTVDSKGGAQRILSVGGAFSADDLPDMAKAGVNTVRVSYWDQSFGSDLANIQNIVKAASALGMKVIINHHAIVARGACWSQQPNGLPFGNACDASVSYDEYKQNMVAMAKAFAGNDTVIGFDLANEPLSYAGQSTWGSGNPSTDLQLIYSDVGAAVQAVDPGALIIAECPQNYSQSFNGGGPAPMGDCSAASTDPVRLPIANKLVYSVHEYPASISGTNATNAQRDNSWGYLLKDNIAPVWIGEIGLKDPNTDGPWADQMLAYMNNFQTAGKEGPGGDLWNWDATKAGPGETQGYKNNPAYFGGMLFQMGGSGCATVLSSQQDIIAASQSLLPQTITQTPNMTLDQVAALASQVGQPGAVVPEDPTVASILAAGPVQDAAIPINPYNSPSGTSPAPGAVSGSTSLNTSGSYGTAVAGPGNASGVIGGTGNVVMGNGGVQTLTVTGPGNSLKLGPYNDTVTLQAAGNTIDMGGGNDTLILAYNGKQPDPSAINADSPAFQPLAATGNVIMLPSPGTGVLTIRGTLAANDKIDLTQALAGMGGWNHQASSLWNYVNVQRSGNGCTISVNNQIIAILPNGSPDGNIGPFIIAN